MLDQDVSTPPEPTPPAHPRSPAKRLAQQASRVRSQPLVTPPRPLIPAPAEPALLPPAPSGPWRWRRVSLVVAALAWALALALQLTPLAQQLGGLAPQTVIAGGWLLAALLTFGPLQWRLGLAGLGWQGALGWTLLGYTLAFVPPPTGNLLELPDLPVYLLLFLGAFYATASVVFPLAFVLGQRLFTDRLQRLDVRRARRQGYEAGGFVVLLLILAGLRVLTPLTGGLLLIVVGLLETLLLSQMPAEG